MPRKGKVVTGMWDKRRSPGARAWRERIEIVAVRLHANLLAQWRQCSEVPDRQNESQLWTSAALPLHMAQKADGRGTTTNTCWEGSDHNQYVCKSSSPSGEGTFSGPSVVRLEVRGIKTRGYLMHSTCGKVDLGCFEIDANLTRVEVESQSGGFRNLKAGADRRKDTRRRCQATSSWTLTTQALCYLEIHCTLLDHRFPNICNVYLCGKRHQRRHCRYWERSLGLWRILETDIASESCAESMQLDLTQSVLP